MPKKIFTQQLEVTKRRGRPSKGWREGVERDVEVLGVRRWRELVIGQNGGTSFDRPEPTVGCSANGRRPASYVYVYGATFQYSGLVLECQTLHHYRGRFRLELGVHGPDLAVCHHLWYA